ncbi:unnamed protein product, partial [Ectocarpus sp. 12 AP-2014]
MSASPSPSAATPSGNASVAAVTGWVGSSCRRCSNPAPPAAASAATLGAAPLGIEAAPRLTLAAMPLAAASGDGTTSAGRGSSSSSAGAAGLVALETAWPPPFCCSSSLPCAVSRAGSVVATVVGAGAASASATVASFDAAGAGAATTAALLPGFVQLPPLTEPLSRTEAASGGSTVAGAEVVAPCALLACPRTSPSPSLPSSSAVDTVTAGAAGGACFSCPSCSPP